MCRTSIQSKWLDVDSVSLMYVYALLFLIPLIVLANILVRVHLLRLVPLVWWLLRVMALMNAARTSLAEVVEVGRCCTALSYLSGRCASAAHGLGGSEHSR